MQSYKSLFQKTGGSRATARNLNRYARGTIATIVLFCCLFAGGASVARAQELNATLSVNSDQVQGSNKQIYNTLQTALMEFINTKKWTTAAFSQNERIDCTFTIIVNKLEGERFSCEIQVQARRPVHNATYTTTIFNHRDTEFDFEYTEYEPLEYTENVLNSNLTATIVYYIYMILGFDFDSFSTGGGQQFFQQAKQIATAAQSQPSWNGWQAFSSKTNRNTLATAITENQASGFHTLWYTYHRKGLDEMAANPDRGRTNLIAALPALKDLKTARPTSALLQLFYDCKLDEVVAIYSKATTQEKQEGLKLLSNLYPTASSRLESLKN